MQGTALLPTCSGLPTHASSGPLHSHSPSKATLLPSSPCSHPRPCLGSLRGRTMPSLLGKPTPSLPGFSPVPAVLACGTEGTLSLPALGDIWAGVPSSPSCTSFAQNKGDGVTGSVPQGLFLCCPLSSCSGRFCGTPDTTCSPLSSIYITCKLTGRTGTHWLTVLQSPLSGRGLRPTRGGNFPTTRKLRTDPNTKVYPRTACCILGAGTSTY